MAEDGNVLPGVPRIQSEVFMAAGKTYDVMINAPATGAGPSRLRSSTQPLRELDCSRHGHAGLHRCQRLNARRGQASALALSDAYNAVIAGQSLVVDDPSRGILANDTNVYGPKVVTGPSQGTVTMNSNGTFTYVANTGWSVADTFTYCGNGATTGPSCATVTLKPETVEDASKISCPDQTFTSSSATLLKIATPGILAGCTDGLGYPVTVDAASLAPSKGLTLKVDPNGGFVASTASAASAQTFMFTFKAKNSQGTSSANTANVTLIFPPPSLLNVKVMDGGDKTTVITDYRWIMEEDRTFFVDPKCTTTPLPAGCPGSSTGVVPNFGTNFHTSSMPVIASGCTGDTSCGANQTVLGKPVDPDVHSMPGDVALCNAATPLITELPRSQQALLSFRVAGRRCSAVH